MLLIEVPVVKEKSVVMDLVEWTPSPLMFDNETIMEVMTGEQWLAVDNSSGSTVAMTRNQLDECVKVSGTYFCFHPAARMATGFGGCTEAVWRQHWQDSRCPINWRPIETEVLSMANDDHLIMVKGSVNMVVRCEAKVDRAVDLSQGMYSLTLPQACRAFTATWSTLKGNREPVEAVTFNVTQDEVRMVWPYGNVSFEGIERPKSVALEADRVAAVLDASTFPVWEVVAMATAGAAVLVVLLLLAFLYLKARYGAPVPVSTSTNSTDV